MLLRTSIGTIIAAIIFEFLLVIIAVSVTVGETALIVVELLTMLLVDFVMVTVGVLDGFLVAVIVDNIVEVDLPLSTLYCIVIVDDSSVGAADNTDCEGMVTFSQSQNFTGTR